jgi:hypothetical protein
MKMELINRNIIVRHILPLFFFFVLFAIGAFGSKLLYVNLIAGSIALLLLGNIFLQNIIISRILGCVFLLGSIYMFLAWLIDKEVTWDSSGDWIGVLVSLLSIAMSVLLVLGFDKKSQLRETERC